MRNAARPTFEEMRRKGFAQVRGFCYSLVEVEFCFASNVRVRSIRLLVRWFRAFQVQKRIRLVNLKMVLDVRELNINLMVRRTREVEKIGSLKCLDSWQYK